MGARVLHRPEYRNFCKLLRSWRVGAGMTQRDLARRLTKPASYVHKTEVGERRIDPIEFIDWCRACERSASATLKAVEVDLIKQRNK